MIVDDDVWIRTGRQSGLARFTDLEVVASMDPAQAAGFDWKDIDVALVDAHDSRQPWDRYPGVGVVEAIRRSRTPEQTTVIVISGRMFDPMLRLRMAEAGADFFYAHLDVPDPDRLAEVIRNPDPAHRSGPGDDASVAPLGLRSWSRPNQALGWLKETGADRFFTDAGTQKTARASRRTLTAVRDQVARLARFDPSLASTGSRPGQPSWRDVAKFVNRALGRDQN